MIRTTSLFMTVSPKNLFFKKKNVKEKVSALLVLDMLSNAPEILQN